MRETGCIAEVAPPTRDVVRPPPSTLIWVRPAILGLTRGATVGLMVEIRDSMWRLGVRMMLCARTVDPSRQANGSSAAVNVIAVLMRRFTGSRVIGPLALRKKRRTPLRRLNCETDDLLLLPLAHQRREIVLAHRAVAELQPEHAALGAIDDRALIVVEQCGDAGNAGILGEPH